MALKKQNFTEEEIAIFDDAVMYKRGEHWHFRMWLADEKKYARISLKTRLKSTAFEKAKDLYLDILADIKGGKKHFSITTKAGVEMYIKHRQKDVETGLIVSGRLTTIKTHLQHWLDYIGRDVKLKELSRHGCEDYFFERMKKNNGNIKQITVQNEQSTINSCISYLFKNNEANIEAFEFKKLQKVDTNNEAIRRATFTGEEYKKLYKAANAYSKHRTNKLDLDEWYVRQMVRHYILIAANSGLRVGEQMQLRWADVATDNKMIDGEMRLFAKINVRAETSKVRKSRWFYCRGGNYVSRLKKLSRHTEQNDLIFSLDGKTQITKRSLLYHFHKIVELADIENAKERDLVPYSLRHFMITQRIMAGLSLRNIADMCGTSETQIERTYYHLNDEIRLTNAAAEFKRSKDGTIKIV